MVRYHATWCQQAKCSLLLALRAASIAMSSFTPQACLALLNPPDWRLPPSNLSPWSPLPIRSHDCLHGRLGGAAECPGMVSVWSQLCQIHLVPRGIFAKVGSCGS
ncbi:hypothetical protein OH76DRAFT_137230 [Lentinus brumalis]|uniref:Uncharacterized protein n=1 Tax=Lentinus brumalis TaxID=2498619 RepID=A0A371CPN7_9APHY|nr:hypothetical protein OH76DRAFT_137230 [Polyporus brumalis]